MKKIFTLICTVLGFASVANAAGIDDVALCKHSYVLVCDEVTNNGTKRPGAEALFGNNMFLDVTGGSVATNKGKSNPAETVTLKNVAGEDSVAYRYGEEFAKKYGEYGAHYNSLRIKNAQDVIAMKVTAGAKLIFLMQGNNKTGKDARIPKIATDAELKNALNAAPTADFKETTSAGYKYEWTSSDDQTIYIGSYNGDAFIGYLIVEAIEPVGTPTFKLGAQKYEGGLWFRELTINATQADAEGEKINTIVTYEMGGNEPSMTSAVYKEPIKVYKDDVVKMQAWLDVMGDGSLADQTQLLTNADNIAYVSFAFDAPTITTNGAKVTVESKYEGAKNYISYLDVTDEEANEVTLSESATVSAYTKITNGEHTVFTSMSATKDAYVLNPIKEKKTIAVVAGKAVVDEEATATSTTGPVYTIEGGKLNTDKMDFFVKNLVYGALPNTSDSLAKYQVPAGKEGYIKMTDTNITFAVAEGDSVNVTVRCTKNSCKNLTDAADASHLCYVNVNGTTYGDTLYSAYKGTTVEDLDKFNNVIKFGLKGAEGGSNFTFQKYSGTGNIMISSIVIQPYNDGKDDEPEYEMEETSEGKYLAVTCAEAKANAWDSQIYINFSKPLEAGKTYVLRMLVKGSEALEGQMGEYGWEAIQPIAQDNNSTNRDEYNGPADLQYMAHFSVTTDWAVTKDHDGNAITIDGKYPYSRLCLNLGKYKGTICFDNLKIIDAEGTVVEENYFETEAEMALVQNGWMNLPKEFVDPNASSLGRVSSFSSSNTVKFNIAGQKTNASKGLMIQNGKVILVK